jgi:hypothetical protein
MSIRTSPPVIVCCVVVVTALGCSSQPTAPSNSGSTPIIGAAALSSGAPASQQTAVSPSRFGNRTPGVVYVTSQGRYYARSLSRIRCRWRGGSTS